MVDKTLILSELMKYKNITSKAKFAQYLGITPQNLSQWFKRNTFDIAIIGNKFLDVNKIWLLTGEGEMLKASTPQVLEANNPNIVSMPADVWAVIKSQADSLKAKDEQTSEAIKQTSEVVALLKEQLKKGHLAEHQGFAASVVEVEG